MKQKLIELKGEMGKSIVYLETSMPLSEQLIE